MCAPCEAFKDTEVGNKSVNPLYISQEAWNVPTKTNFCLVSKILRKKETHLESITALMPQVQELSI